MNQPLTIVADAHIWGLKSAFSALPGYDISLHALESRDIKRSALEHADILLTRSATRVNAELLAGTPVRFAGTATIGDDHYDKGYLQEHGIAFANAAGSSTGSVIEYMLAALLDLHVRGLIDIPETTIGIIGAGRIGSALALHCRAIGMQVLINDPPRARTEGDASFSSLDTVLQQADIVSMHTPLIRSGIDQTMHLLDQHQLQRFRGRGIINAARGACLDNQALCEWLDAAQDHFAVLDCWEHEPHVATRLLGHPGMAIATPHIAGHSLDGKAANTQYIHRALCDWLGISSTWEPGEHLPASTAGIPVPCTDDVYANIQRAVSSLYPLQQDCRAMQAWAALPEKEMATNFSAYRRHYPARRAWQSTPIHLLDADVRTRELAHAIGLTTV